VDECADGTASLDQVLGRIELLCVDPCEVDARWLSDADAVIHLAGMEEWSTRSSDMEVNWLANAVVTERLALACRLTRVPRLTCASTCEVYSNFPAGYEYDETAPVQPRSAFAASKVYAERRLQQLADDQFCPVILRHATPYGDSPRSFFETTPNRFVMDAVSLGRVALPKNSWITRPLVDVADLAEAHVRCLEAPASRVRAQIFNVVHTNVRIQEIGVTVAEVVGSQMGYVRLSATEVSAEVRDCRCSPANTPGRTLAAAVESMARRLSLRAGAAGMQMSGPGALAEANPMMGGHPARLLGERISGSYSCGSGEAPE
jgi:nucleoside-diphosphate-sugar epimerase